MTKRSKFGWMELVLGLLFILLGIITLINPGIALSGVVVIYSLTAIITGITDIVFYVKLHSATGFGPGVSLASGIISVLAGLLLLLNPAFGGWIFSIVFAVWFISHSISRLANQRYIRYVAGRGMSVVSTVLNALGVLLGVVMLVRPRVTALSLGFLVAVGLMVHGASSIIEAFSRLGEQQPPEWEVR
ncbi:DUF308 domain-containing protein [Ruminococcaceae bacterium OttesenSCG-928-D13]|nr:DUF308 domain-containing protein [Ruminococcaceae bacterium OttesenSCG-928-D13]